MYGSGNLSVSKLKEPEQVDTNDVKQKVTIMSMSLWFSGETLKRYKVYMKRDEEDSSSFG